MNRWLRIFYVPDGAPGGGDTPPADTPPAAPAAPPAGDPPPADDNPWKGFWGSSLPNDFREANKTELLLMKEKGTTMKDVVEETFSHRKNMERALIVPKEDDPPEVKKAFMGKMGIPESPDGYGLDAKVLGDLDKDGAFTKATAERYYKKGMTKAQAQEAFNVIAETAKGALAAKAKMDKDAAEQFDSRFAALVSEGEKDPVKAAAKAKESIEYFKRFMIGLGDKALVKRMRDSGILYDPQYAAAMSAYHKRAFGEADYVAGEPQGGSEKKGPEFLGHSSDFDDAYGRK